MATKALLGRVEVVVSLFRSLINLDLEKTNAERERERERRKILFKTLVMVYIEHYTELV